MLTSGVPLGGFRGHVPERCVAAAAPEPGVPRRRPSRVESASRSARQGMWRHPRTALLGLLFALCANHRHFSRHACLAAPCGIVHQFGITEHSPLYVPELSVMICRNPKVATAMLRSVVRSYKENRTFEYAPGVAKREHTIAATPNDFDLDEVAHKIMFVRHPVSRTLSGWLTIHPRGTPTEFQRFVMSGAGSRYNVTVQRSRSKESRDSEELSLQSYYSGTCDRKNDRKHSLDKAVQHWAPGQHCRCGRELCGIGWRIIQVEETDAVMNTLQRYFPSWSLPTAQHGLLHHRESAQNGALHEFLTSAVVAKLNVLTSKEQLALGYSPYRSASTGTGWSAVVARQQQASAVTAVGAAVAAAAAAEQRAVAAEQAAAEARQQARQAQQAAEAALREANRATASPLEVAEVAEVTEVVEVAQVAELAEVGEVVEVAEVAHVEEAVEVAEQAEVPVAEVAEVAQVAEVGEVAVVTEVVEAEVAEVAEAVKAAQVADVLQVAKVATVVAVHKKPSYYKNGGNRGRVGLGRGGRKGGLGGRRGGLSGRGPGGGPGGPGEGPSE